MESKSKKASLIGVFANAGLFIIKIVVGLLSNSLALISEALNSFLDVVTSLITFFSVHIAGKEPDASHPFGHKRVEPIAGLITAIFAAVLGIEVMRSAIGRLIAGEEVVMQGLAITVLLVTMAVKAVMAVYFKAVGREERNTAVFASAIDCRNDVLVAFGAIIGIAGTKFGYNFLDPLAALFIAIWILKSGYDIGKQNIDFLVGSSPPKSVLRMIKDRAYSVKAVRNAHDLKAHFVGSCLHVEIHIGVDKELSTARSHAIGKRVQKEIESLKIVDRAFVHIDPWPAKK